MKTPGPQADDEARLRELVDAGHACLTIVTPEESHALELVRAVAMAGGRRLLVWSASRGVHGGLFDDAASVPKTEHAAAALYHFAHQLDTPAICATLDLVDHLDDPRTRRALRDVLQRFRETQSCLVMIDHKSGLPDIVASEAMPVEVKLPDDDELEEIIRRTLRRVHRERPIEARTSRTELDTIVRNLHGLTRLQAEQIIVECVAGDRTFDAADINTILAHKRKRLHRDGVLEFVETPVDLSQIGGLRSLKRWLDKRRSALSAEAQAYGLPAPRGVLLLGVQGAGKSLCAKAIAAAWQRPLLRLDPGVLYDRYVGESERRLRGALEQAEAMAPIILWIDEIEKGFASAAAQSTDGGLSQRMFGTLLSWMQEHTRPVFLVATANNIEALPPELLRKGRFDEIFFVDLPDRDVRREIFEIHLAKRGRDPAAFDLDALADAADGYSGAEIEQAILSALHDSFAAGEPLDTPMVIAAVRASPPLSVTMAERVRALRLWASSRCVPAD